MKVVFTFLALILTISTSATAQVKTSYRDAKVGIVRSWDEASVKGNTATLDRLLADEFTFVGGPKKADYLASFKASQLVIQSALSSDIEVQVYGDSAVLTGVDTIIAKNKDQTLLTKWL